MTLELQGARFALRSMRKDDIHAVYQGLSNPQVIAHYGVSYDSLEATQVQMDWFASIKRDGSGQWWALCDRAAPTQLLGACGFNHKYTDHTTIEL
jgi:ribosomal-protein-alanine N-acetyltransferase